MEIYNEIQTFTCNKEMKEFFKQMKRNKVNVSKFIRDSVKKNMTEIKQDKRKKPTLEDLKRSFNLFEKELL